MIGSDLPETDCQRAANIALAVMHRANAQQKEILTPALERFWTCGINPDGFKAGEFIFLS